MAVFNILMFANGLWHMVWWVFVDTRCCSGIVKKYVPGLVTAPLFVVTLKMQFIPELMRITDDF